MDLSKAFDSITHELLTAKIHAYDFSIDALTFFYSFLKKRKQNVSINNRINSTHSVFQIFLSEVPQGSIFGQFYSTYLLMLFISGYQKQTC